MTLSILCASKESVFTDRVLCMVHKQRLHSCDAAQESQAEWSIM